MEVWKIRALEVNVRSYGTMCTSVSDSVNFADFSRKNSLDFGDNSRESEVVFLKERKLIPTGLVYNGTQRLSFLMETCPPGTVPDAFLLASSLDLVGIPIFSNNL